MKKVIKQNLIPGNLGEDCPFNGLQGFECECGECDYQICCQDKNYPKCCKGCDLKDCIRKNKEEVIKILQIIKNC